MIDIEGTIFEDYSSVVFDLDQTIWECFTPEGTSIGAYTMVAPFELKSGVLIKDINGNYCKLQEGVRTLLKSLDADDMNLGIVSSGEKEDTPQQAQPSVMLLKKFDLYKYFNLYIICKRGINKREYVRPFGRTLFIDDDTDNLEEVKINKKVDVLDRKAFDDWDQLFQKKTSSLLLGLSGFLIKRSQEDFQYTSGASILLSLYQAELDYTITNRRLIEGEEVTDEENIRYLNAKQKIPRLFEDAISYLTAILSDTVLYAKKLPALDFTTDKEDYKRSQESLLKRFNIALAIINNSSKYIYNESQWPQIFINVDNVINLMHGELPYITHMIMADEVNLEDSYETYVKDKNIPQLEAENTLNKHITALEAKWEEFSYFLTQQGKSLEFNINDKLSWQISPEVYHHKVTDEDGTIYYYNEKNELHHIDGPALEYPDGYKAWYQNGNLHREDGPAVEAVDGYKAWYQNGERHRLNGPAIEWLDGSKDWYINDVPIGSSTDGFTGADFENYKREHNI